MKLFQCKEKRRQYVQRAGDIQRHILEIEKNRVMDEYTQSLS
jgi:hypothetical protein